jgi:hypothetical protein
VVSAGFEDGGNYMMLRLLLGSVLLVLLVAGARGAAAAPSADWVPVGSWSGTASERTGPFDTEGPHFRILWTVSGAEPVSIFRILVYRADGVLETTAVDVTGRSNGANEVHAPPGQYTLQVDAENLPWSVTVEDAR